LKAVITAAGLGTRLLPATKEMPKEMLPLFTLSSVGLITLKPVIQIVFESLYNAGIRDFCFVVGRGKRVLEDYFTPDYSFDKLLRTRGLVNKAEELLEFYKAIESSRIFFVNQPEPKGFGDAVLRAKAFVSNEPFILHAGDDVVLSENSSHVQKLINVFNKYLADSVFLVEEIEDPRQYGVIIGKTVNNHDIVKVLDIVEKPRRPPSNLAVIAIYMFKPKIFNYLEEVKPDEKGEIQLTTAIKMLVDNGGEVYAVKLKPDERRLDVGTPNNYWKALYESYQWALRKLRVS